MKLKMKINECYKCGKKSYKPMAQLVFTTGGRNRKICRECLVKQMIGDVI